MTQVGTFGSMAGLKNDLNIMLATVEKELMGCGLDWKNVLYVHLYLSDMKEFAAANETYVTFITHEKCPLGVPSRSTVELPLVDVGLGGAYIEVLVTTDQSKKVLHVQSISSWAPSCIGPYSQVGLKVFLNDLWILPLFIFFKLSLFDKQK